MEAGLRRAREEDISVILLNDGAGSTLSRSTFGGNRALPWDPEKSVFEDPGTGECGVARFIQVEIEGCTCVPSLSASPWKRSSCVFSKARTKASVQSFCFIVKALAVPAPIHVA